MGLFGALKTMFGYPVAKREPAVQHTYTETEFGRKLKEIMKGPMERARNLEQYGLRLTDQEMLERKNKAIHLEPVVDSVKLRSQIPEWWCMSGIDPSPAEQLIMEELRKYPVDWHREVCFTGFVNENGNPYRYDFYIPQLNLICEYDGKKWHSFDRQFIDSIKDEYCQGLGITMVRYSSTHYYKLAEHIEQLMNSYGIARSVA